MKKSFKALAIIDECLHYIPAVMSIFAFYYYKRNFEDTPFLSEMVVVIFASVAPVVILAGKRLQKLHDAIIAGAGCVLFAEFLYQTVSHPFNSENMLNCGIASAISLAVAVLYLLSVYGRKTKWLAHVLLYSGILLGMVMVLNRETPMILFIFTFLFLDATLKPAFGDEDSEEVQNEQEN